MTSINIPKSDRVRIVIVGAGFAGLKLARELSDSPFQIVLLDKNNYHQFQPLFYQVAMAGLEPSSISFPLRKVFQRNDRVYIRVTEVERIDQAEKRIYTPLGTLDFDYLIIAIGADTNFFGNRNFAEKCIPMKSVSEALYLRNLILADYEKALTATDYRQRQGFIDIVIVGGGPTGVEVAGALAEMKRYILPKDYQELPVEEIDIYLIQGGPVLLPGMSSEAAEAAEKFLKDLGVIVKKNTRVVDYDGTYVYTKDGEKIQSNKVIWAAGIIGNHIEGLPAEAVTHGRRLRVDHFNKVEGTDDIYAIGDIAYMVTEQYPNGHPQVAQVAIQQARQLAKNLIASGKGRPWKPFQYKDHGSMATIGRNRAVVDLPRFRFQGFFAWIIWLIVHLFALIGIRNRLIVFINWVWNYFTYDQSLRLIIRPKPIGESSADKE